MRYDIRLTAHQEFIEIAAKDNARVWRTLIDVSPILARAVTTMPGITGINHFIGSLRRSMKEDTYIIRLRCDGKLELSFLLPRGTRVRFNLTFLRWRRGGRLRRVI